MGLLNAIQKKWGTKSKEKSLKPKTRKEATKNEREKFSHVGAQAAPEAAMSGSSAVSTGHSTAYRVIIGPVVTEKSAHLTSEGKYVFRVPIGTTKSDAIRAVNLQYGIKPTKVASIRKRARRVRYGKVRGVTKRWTKIIVTMPKGKTLDVYGT